MRRLVGPTLIALAALTATLATIAPDGNGPGVTCDELYLVNQGKELVTALRQQGFAFFRPANIDRNFPWTAGGPPVQAPLGHWILGWTNYLFDPKPDDPLALSVTAARFAPAIAFALLILMVGGWTARREGTLAGTFAAAAVALQPRLFGHAHLAAFDMFTALFFVAALLAVIAAARGGRAWHFALAGVAWGVAMLVRLHGLLLAPPVIVWLVWRFFRTRPEVSSPGSSSPRWQLSKCVGAWFAAGAATFVVGWPWLWLAPIARFQQYLASGTARQPLHVFYAGHVWLDRNVPWHYPWVMFAVTVPLGLLVLGVLGIVATMGSAPTFNARYPKDRVQPSAGSPRIRSLSKEEGTLLLVTMILMLALFSLPGTPVYDGVRLFLMVFPIWAIWVGIGAQQLCCWRSLQSRSRSDHTNPKRKQGKKGTGSEPTSENHTKDAGCEVPVPFFRGPRRRFGLVSNGSPIGIKTTAVALFMALQGIGLAIYCPCHLSYYNLLVGGLRGAEKLGFEVTYWGDTVREPILAEAVQLSHGKPILFAPNLAPFQVAGVEMCSPALRDAGVRLIGSNPSKPTEADQCEYAVIYHRRADLADLEGLLRQGKVVDDYSKRGVWLTRLVQLPPRRNEAGD